MSSRALSALITAHMYGLDWPFAKMDLIYLSSNFPGPRLGCAATNVPSALMCPAYDARVLALLDRAASASEHSTGSCPLKVKALVKVIGKVWPPFEAGSQTQCFSEWSSLF